MSGGHGDVTGIPILRKHEDTNRIVWKPSGHTETDCWFIYKVLVHTSSRFTDRDLIIIFTANQCGSGQMVKSISWWQPATISQWEGRKSEGWPMRGLVTSGMCWHVTWTQAEWWKFFGPGPDVFNVSGDTLQASDWNIFTFQASDCLLGDKCFQTCWHQHHEHYEAIKPGSAGDCQ